MLLWLEWFAAFLREVRVFAPFSAQAEAVAHQWLDRIEQVLVRIVLFRAAPHLRTFTVKHSPRRRIETHFWRAIMGSAMRRALRAKDLTRRITALSQDVDVLVARFLKRLPRGLTRRRPHYARREPRLVHRRICDAVSAPCADTS